MIISSVYNEKGGVGKSALSALLSETLASADFRVLVIDNDPQGTLSNVYFKIPFGSKGMGDVYLGKSELLEVVYQTEIVDNLFIAPPGDDFKGSIIEANRISSSEEAVGKLFKRLYQDDIADSIDFVIFDNPPSDIGYVRYCTEKAHKIIIPTIPDEPSLTQLGRAYEEMRMKMANWTEQEKYVVPSIVPNTKQQKKFMQAMRMEISEKQGDNIIVTDAMLLARQEVKENLYEGVNGALRRNASPVTKQIISLCLEIFPELNETNFEKTIKSKVVELREAHIEKLKKFRFKKGGLKRDDDILTKHEMTEV